MLKNKQVVAHHKIVMPNRWHSFFDKNPPIQITKKIDKTQVS